MVMINYKHLAEIKSKGVEGIARSFGDVAQQHNRNFVPNHLLKPGYASYEKFQACLGNLPDYAALGLVYHGTPIQNVGAILKDGLDPSKRKRQTKGPGEYFSWDTRYCQRISKGGEVLVFVVVLPIVKGEHVVVENNNYQLPIGVLGDKWTRHVAQPKNIVGAKQPRNIIVGKQPDNRMNVASSSNVQVLSACGGEPLAKRQRFDAYRSPEYAVINVQKLIVAEQPEEASELYKSFQGKLDVDHKIRILEILKGSSYLSDDELITFFFPGLNVKVSTPN